MNNWKTPKDWSSIDLESRKQWYLKVGEAYHRTRPNYDAQLIQHIVELTHLTPQSQLLELGCGTGKATLEFAKYNLSLLGLDPNPEFYAIAQQNLKAYPNIQLALTSFEEWQPSDLLFDAIIAANSFHWLPSEISFPKCYQLLKDKGYLILIWNLSLQPSWEIYQYLKPIYQKNAPSLDKYETIEQQERVLKQFEKMVIDSQLFGQITTEKKVCQVTYSIEDYATLLSTYSPYIALESSQKQALFTELTEELLMLTDRTIPLTYLTAAQICSKNSHSVCRVGKDETSYH